MEAPPLLRNPHVEQYIFNYEELQNLCIQDYGDHSRAQLPAVRNWNSCGPTTSIEAEDAKREFDGTCLRSFSILLPTASSIPALQTLSLITSPGFHVGVIGAGHLGKQLIQCLLNLTELRPGDISVSTRRPDTLREVQDRGVQCFYNNLKLVRRSQIVFLCCLPSQLPAVCAEIRGHLPEWCVVYSLVSAVPLSRVIGLLGHSSVIRPEYQCDNRDDGPLCHQYITLTEALKNGSLVRTTIPCNPQIEGEVHIVSRFMEPALYAVLNMCTSHGLSHDQAGTVLNCIIQQSNYPQESVFTSSNFVSKEFAATLLADSLFHRFDLSHAQMKETPLSQKLPQLQTQLASLYCAIFHVDAQQANFP